MMPPSGALGGSGGAFFPPRRPARSAARRTTPHSAGTAAAEAPAAAGGDAPRWPSARAALEGAKRLSAEHLAEPLREAQRVVSQAAERVPHAAKVLGVAAVARNSGNPALRKALIPSGRLDDVAFLQRELLRTLEEKRALERRCLEAELALSAALEAAAKAKAVAAKKR